MAEAIIAGKRYKGRQYTRTPLSVRFWRHVAKTEGCWFWTGNKLLSGYGVMHVRGKDGSRDCQLRVHRLSYELHYGQIAEGMDVLHRCDNPACVRPDHLFVGSAGDNARDKVSKGRQARGETHGHSLVTEAQVRELRSRFAAGGVTYKALGAEYGLSRSGATDIIKGKRWGHVR